MPNKQEIPIGAPCDDKEIISRLHKYRLDNSVPLVILALAVKVSTKTITNANRRLRKRVRINLAPMTRRKIELFLAKAELQSVAQVAPIPPNEQAEKVKAEVVA